jgi:hypothetical protein
MNFIASVLLLTALTIPTPTLVLKSGARIAVDAPVKVDSGTVLFRSGGSLYSIPSEEVDLDATRAAAAAISVVASDTTSKLRVTPSERERLLRDLEQNHAGTAATQEQMNIPPSNRPRSEQANSDDEWSWKNAARAHEEEIRRAKEQLDLLQNRAAELTAQISGFLSLGYKPSQFSYQTTVLAMVQEQIPQAELEVRRAERSYQQFLDEARRKGIMPGWLR